MKKPNHITINKNTIKRLRREVAVLTGFKDGTIVISKNKIGRIISILMKIIHRWEDRNFVFVFRPNTQFEKAKVINFNKTISTFGDF